MTLFEIVGDFQKLYELMVDTDVSEEAVQNALDDLTDDLSNKAEGYVEVRKQLQAEIMAAEKEQAEWGKKIERREMALKKLDATLLNAMDALGEKEIPAGKYKIKARGNGGKQPIKITGTVPEEFWKIKTEKVEDKTKIGEYLAKLPEGEKCDWAYLAPRSKRIVVE